VKDDVYYGDHFVWARGKNTKNRRKHHISFETAVFVFDDPFYTEAYDEDNSEMEDRYNVTGSITGLINNILVTVSVTYRDGFIRIISARDADPAEAGDYYEQFENYLGRKD
jgi:uncharacterized DUF497 family protein